MKKLQLLVFSSRVSLLAFYFLESFIKSAQVCSLLCVSFHDGSLTEDKDKALSAKVINLGM